MSFEGVCICCSSSAEAETVSGSFVSGESNIVALGGPVDVSLAGSLLSCVEMLSGLKTSARVMSILLLPEPRRRGGGGGGMLVLLEAGDGFWGLRTAAVGTEERGDSAVDDLWLGDETKDVGMLSALSLDSTAGEPASGLTFDPGRRVGGGGGGTLEERLLRAELERLKSEMPSISEDAKKDELLVDLSRVEVRSCVWRRVSGTEGALCC